MEIALGLGVLAVVVAIYGVNRLVKLRNRVQAAWADLDVHLARRRHLVPNLVATVQAYASHERETLGALTAARSEGDQAQDAAAQSSAEGRVDEALGRVVALAEDYPDLRADERFRALHTELVATENRIAFSRQLYNDTVTAYRNATQRFPGTLFAGPLGFAPPALFAAEAGARGATRVRLDSESDETEQ